MTKKISIDVESKSIEDVIKYLQVNEGVNFSYSKNIIKLNQRVSVHLKQTNLEVVLNELFSKSEIIYKVKSGIVILQRKPQNIDKMIISGTVKSISEEAPLEFVGIQMIAANTGTITDKNGNFSMVISKEQINDSISISSLGYERAVFPVSNFIHTSQHIIFLKQRMIKLAEVEISARNFKTVSMGNHKIFSFGSIYIDTQGQQTALFIENKKKKNGTISSVSYYLSSKGNISSPFRVRIYERDSVTMKPGRDLLKEVIIAKPDNDGGWFKIDISQFDVEAPTDGFFVAIEGIYPNDFANESDQFENVENVQDNYVPNSISYGQRLGYSNKNGENTWHYSLAHTWFQLKEQNYNVMISAEIQTRKHKRKKRDN